MGGTEGGYEKMHAGEGKRGCERKEGNRVKGRKEEDKKRGKETTGVDGRRQGVRG